MDMIKKDFVLLNSENKENTKKLENIFFVNYNLLAYDHKQNPYQGGSGLRVYKTLMLAAEKQERKIYQINGSLVGFYIVFKARMADSKHNKSFFPGDAVLVLMAVHNDHRRKGYGKNIMEKVIEWSANQGANAAWVAVIENNNVAINLYKKFGFCHTGLYQNQDETKGVKSIWLIKKLSNSFLYEYGLLPCTNQDVLFKYND